MRDRIGDRHTQLVTLVNRRSGPAVNGTNSAPSERRGSTLVAAIAAISSSKEKAMPLRQAMPAYSYSVSIYAIHPVPISIFSKTLKTLHNCLIRLLPAASRAPPRHLVSSSTSLSIVMQCHTRERPKLVVVYSHNILCRPTLQVQRVRLLQMAEVDPINSIRRCRLNLLVGNIVSMTDHPD